MLAVDYALTWSEDGTNGNHNDAYPDWGFDDCTNFISQAAHAAHHHMTGSGDGCRYEGTATEWYIRPNPDPPFWCVGDFPDWEWSTSWTVTWDFRNYFAYQHDYAQVIGWTLDHTLANYYLTLGDVIQLEYLNNQGQWINYHTMIVTMQDDDRLYVTYHSNIDGMDEVNRPLDEIDTDPTHRYVLIKMLPGDPNAVSLVAINANAQWQWLPFLTGLLLLAFVVARLSFSGRRKTAIPNSG